MASLLANLSGQVQETVMWHASQQTGNLSFEVLAGGRSPGSML